MLERLCSVFLFYPYRCQLCAHRFLARPEPKGHAHHREFERITVRFPTSFSASYLGSRVTGEGTLHSLSIRGCGLATTSPAEKGAFLRVLFSYAEHEAPIEVQVAVVRSVEEARMGLEFLGIKPEEEERLRYLMETLLAGRPR